MKPQLDGSKFLLSNGPGVSSSSYGDNLKSPSPRSNEDHSSLASAPSSIKSVDSRPVHVMMETPSTANEHDNVSRYQSMHFGTHPPRRHVPHTMAAILHRLEAKVERRRSLVRHGSLASPPHKDKPLHLPLLREKDEESPLWQRRASISPVSTGPHPRGLDSDGDVDTEYDERALLAMSKLGSEPLSDQEVRALAITREGAKAIADLLDPKPEAEAKSEAVKTTRTDVAATSTIMGTITTIATAINEKCNPNGDFKWLLAIYGISFLSFVIGLLLKNYLLTPSPKSAGPSKTVANALESAVAKEDEELPVHKTAAQVHQLIQFLTPQIIESLAGGERGV